MRVLGAAMAEFSARITELFAEVTRHNTKAPARPYASPGLPIRPA